MKKSLLFLSFLVCCVFAASAQCTTDTTHFTRGVYVYPASLPCITQGVPFSGTVSIKAPDSIDVHNFDTTLPSGLYYIHLDSMAVDSVTGFPAGITATDNPTFGTWIKGGAFGCSLFVGTTTAVVDTYPLAIHGRACGHGTFPIFGTIDTCAAFNFSRIFPYSLNVCAPTVVPVCTPDTTHFAAGKYVYPDTLPCITPGTPYSGVISIQIPDSIDAGPLVGIPGIGYAYIDSMRIDSITALPAGITAGTSPGFGQWLEGGEFGCIKFDGTTTAPGGAYQLNLFGKGCIHGNFFGVQIDTCRTGNLGSYLNYSLNVCTGVGVTEITEGVNLNVYPNPNKGAFTVTLGSADHTSGQLSVMDQLGRVIHTQSIEVTGTKQLPLELGTIAQGVYVLMLNTANGKSVKTFSVK